MLAAWVSLGPNPVNGAQVAIPPNNDVVGAIETIAVHPFDPNTVYIGAVNGGVWKTIDGGVNWTALTDNLVSQSIGDIAFDIADGSGNTLVVGTGRFSSFGLVGDDLPGLYRTTDGGANWTVLNSASVAGKSTTSVVAAGAIILAGNTTDGLWRSTDTGANWTKISSGAVGALPLNADVLDLVTDPSTSGASLRVYAAVRGQGIFRSDDAGATWTNVTGTINTVTSNGNMHMAVHNSGGGNVVYLMTINNTGALNGVWYSTNQGGAWTAMDVPSIFPGNQGDIHGAITADPTNPNLVYIAGDRITASPFTGNIVRGNRSLALGSQFTSLVDTGANNTSPHADSRALAFLSTGVLLNANDGGIYQLASPAVSGAATRWTTFNGNLQVAEAHDIAWDAISNTVIAGLQDNGTVQQSPFGGAWSFASGGDGGDVAVDNVSLAGSNQAIRYFSSQNLGGFRRQVIDASNNVISTTFISTAVITDPQFVTPIRVNAVDPLRILIGGSGTIYESLNQGNTITALGGPGVNGTFETPMIYGGISGGIPNPDLIYVGQGNRVYRRTTSGGAITATTALPAGGSTVRDVTVDPDDWNTVFAVDNNQVFYSTNAGNTWSDVTGLLTTISSNEFQTLAYVPGLTDDSIVVGTRSGVFSARVSSLAGVPNWTKVSTGLPDVLVYELDYNQADNILIAGTLGRGAWSLSNASNELNNSAPTNLTLSNSTLPENSGAGFPIGTFTTTDPDPGNTFTYSLVGGAGSTDNAFFGISGNALQELNSLDFESQSSYSIRVRTTDQGSLSFEKVFTITVTNVLESPTNLTLSSNSIAEGAGANATIGTLVTTDSDIGDTFTYTFVAGAGSTDNGSFNLAGNALRENASFDFETKSSYTVRIRTTDQTGLFFEKAFTINVTNVNENPTNLALSNSTILENSGTNFTIGTFTTTDPDIANTFTYSLVAGAGSTDNSSFNILGGALRENVSFDFETKNSYDIRVRTTDQGGLFFEQAFTITITDVVFELARYGAAGVDGGKVNGKPSQPWVKVVDLVSGDIISEFLAYEATYKLGVQVVMADLTGDLVPEVITAPGRLHAPEIRVFTLQGVELPAFRTMAYAANFVNGINIAVGDVDGDGKNDIVAAPARGVAEIRVFKNQYGAPDPIANDPIYRFNAFPKSFIGGAAVGVGDLDGDFKAEIAVGSGSGRVSTVVVFNPATLPLIAPNAVTPVAPPPAFAQYSNFFSARYLGGIASIAVGRINVDLTPDIIVGQGQGGNSLIAMLDGNSGRAQINGTFLPTVQVASQFGAYSDAGSRAAVYLALRDSDGDGIMDVLFTGQASDGRANGVMRVFKPTAPFPFGTVPVFGSANYRGITVG